MQTNRMRLCGGSAGLAGMLWLGLAAAEDAAPDTGASARSEPAAVDAGKDDAAEATPRVSLAVARDRARLMHDIYSATLDTMHQRYFHGERAVVPARAMEDVFEEIRHQTHSESRWISASFSPMSIDHEPQTRFEKEAARKIAKGDSIVETIEDGYYRRAGSISLGGGCTSCHAGFFANTSPAPKFAGLIISIPVDRDVKLADTEATPTP